MLTKSSFIPCILVLFFAITLPFNLLMAQVDDDCPFFYELMDEGNSAVTYQEKFEKYQLAGSPGVYCNEEQRLLAVSKQRKVLRDLDRVAREAKKVAIENERQVEVIREQNDQNKRLALESEEARIKAEQQLLIVRQLNEKADSLGLLNIQEQEKNQRIVDNLFFYKDRFGWAFNGKNYGFMDRNGEVVIPFEYSSATPFDVETSLSIVKKSTDSDIQYFLDTLGRLQQYASSLSDLSLNNQFEIIDVNFQFFESKFSQKILKQTNTLKLTIDQPGLSEIPDEISDLRSLEVLNILNHKLTNISESIGELKKLRVLSLITTDLLEHNFIQMWILGIKIYGIRDRLILPSSFGEFSNLEVLNLRGCRLRSFPYQIFLLSNLTSLNLSTTGISIIPEGIQNLEKLKFLSLSNNRIKKIPEKIGKLIELETLDLRMNPIVHDEEAILHLRKLLPNCQIRI